MYWKSTNNSASFNLRIILQYKIKRNSSHKHGYASDLVSKYGTSKGNYFCIYFLNRVSNFYRNLANFQHCNILVPYFLAVFCYTSKTNINCFKIYDVLQNTLQFEQP